VQEFDFVAPNTLEEACQVLAQGGGRLVAGGTDIIPQMLNGRFQARRLIDLSRLCELSYIQERGEWIAIGALTTYAELVESALLQSEAAALVQAAATVGCVQTRNRGTLGGNIGNASPAGDALPPLLALDAQVALTSLAGERSLALRELLLGPGKTAIRPDEVIREIVFRRLPDGAKSAFLRLGSRQGMAVSVVSVAVVLGMAAGRVSLARLALGAVAPTPLRATQAEATLAGWPLDEARINAAAEAAASACAPISDVRGTAEYRRHAVRVLVRRGLQALAQVD
jgi:xanthine dehydrogenase FAD-binding subunit